MAKRISDMTELTASINNSSSVFSFVDNTESNSADQNKKITFDNFLKLFVENFDDNPNNDLIVSSSLQIFPASDISADTKVKVYRNLTINSGVTVTPNVACRGLLFICTGNFINSGTVTMTGKGANTSSSYPYNTLNQLYGNPWQLSLDNPVANQSNNFRFAKSGSIWTNIISPPSKYSLTVFGLCGNGGNGGNSQYKSGGLGGNGSMFGGGGGGGGASTGFSPNPATPRGSPGGPAVGISGGNGANSGPNYFGDEGGGGGGAGIPGGSRGVSGPLASVQATTGSFGVGGSICIIAKGNFNNLGTISSQGSNGGQGGGAGGAGGGGSGGGSITIIYGGGYIGGTINTNGGGGGSSQTPAPGSGNSGSPGSFTSTNINFI